MTTMTLPHHTSPLRVSETSEQEDSNDIYFKRWEKYSALPPETQKKLESEETAATIQKIQKFRNLSDETTANIARMIRGYYFGEIKEFDFVPYLMREPNIDQAAAARLAQLVVKEVIEAKPEQTDASHQSDEASEQQKSLPLLKALSRYPKLENYILTQQTFVTSEDTDKKELKGTIKNWIFDYHMSNRGKARRTFTDREQYLSDSKNAQRLSEEDSQKVLLVLESFDDSTPLLIDIEKKEIIFNIVIKETEVEPKNTSTPPQRPTIGRGISKQASDGQDHFNDKFASTHAGERPPLKHEEMTVPLQARAGASEKDTTTPESTDDQEVATQHKSQPKRLPFQMNPIDTYTPKTSVQKELPAKNNPDPEMTDHAEEESEERQKDISTAEEEVTAQNKTTLPITREEDLLSNTEDIEQTQGQGELSEEIPEEEDKTIQQPAKDSTEVLRDQEALKNDTPSKKEEEIAQETTLEDASSEEILPASLDLTLDDEESEQDKPLITEEIEEELSEEVPIDIADQVQQEESLLDEDLSTEDTLPSAQHTDEPSSTTEESADDSLPEDTQESSQKVIHEEPSDEDVLPASLDLTLDDEELLSETEDQEKTSDADAAVNTQELNEEQSVDDTQAQQDDQEKISSPSPTEETPIDNTPLDEAIESSLDEDLTLDEEPPTKDTDAPTQKTDENLSVPQEASTDFIAEKSEASFIEISEEKSDEEELILTSNDITPDEDVSAQDEDDTTSAQSVEKEDEVMDASTASSAGEDVPPAQLPVTDDPTEIPDIMTPKEETDPIINLPRSKVDNASVQNDVPDDAQEEIQPEKKKPKRSPFQMKPIK